MQSLFAILLISLCIWAHIFAGPFADPRMVPETAVCSAFPNFALRRAQNMLEFATLLNTFITFLCGQFLYIDECACARWLHRIHRVVSSVKTSSISPAQAEIASGIIVFLNSSYFIGGLLYLIYTFVRRNEIRRSVRRVHLR